MASIDINMNNANDLVLRENFAQAHQIYEKILNDHRNRMNNSERSTILTRMATCSNRLQYYSRAVREANLALEENSINIIALKQRSISHGQMQNVEQARIDIEDALLLSPSDIELQSLAEKYKADDLKSFTETVSRWCASFFLIGIGIPTFFTAVTIQGHPTRLICSILTPLFALIRVLIWLYGPLGFDRLPARVQICLAKCRPVSSRTRQNVTSEMGNMDRQEDTENLVIEQESVL